MSIAIKYLIILFLLISPINLFSQDSQYWSKQYGTYGELLGGTVVGGISDLSATYYNPGSMAFTTDSALILTTNSIQAYAIKMNNLFGANTELTSSSVSASPGIFAVRLPNWLGDEQIAFSYISRYDFNFESHDMVVSNYSDGSPNKLANSTLINQSLSEFWPGITWSKEISKTFGLGATVYFPFRSQNLRHQLLFQTHDSLGTNSSEIFFEEYSYFNLRMLLKLGASIILDNLMLGLTITTPSINIYGSGETSINYSVTNEKFFQTESLPTFFSNYQEKLKANFYSPLSIAFGTAYYWEKTSLYFTVEWFNAVDEFKIMNPNKFNAQSNGKLINYNTSFGLSSIINYGVGIKYVLNKDFTYYGSLTTDKSAYNPEKSNKFILSNWDILHARIGGMINVDNLSVTLGLGYGFTSNIYDKINILNSNSQSESDITYQQIDIVFGFTYKL